MHAPAIISPEDLQTLRDQGEPINLVDVHPAFLALFGLLAVGLIVAGVNARCGLTALLARMPWNGKEPARRRPPDRRASSAGPGNPPTGGAI